MASTDQDMVDALRAAGMSDARISEGIGYSGKSGSRDIETFLRGTAKGMDERRAKLAAMYAATVGPTTIKAEPVKTTAAAPVALKPVTAGPAKPHSSAPLTDQDMVDALRAAGMSDARISEGIGYSGKSGSRDIETFLRGTAKGMDERRAKLAAMYVATVGPTATGPVNKSPSSADFSSKIPTQGMEDTFLVNALLSAGVTAAELSRQIGYAGGSGKRDITAFLQGRCRQLDERRAKLRTFYDATMGSRTTASTLDNAAMVNELRTKYGITDAALSRSIGFAGSHGTRDVDSFLQGRCRFAAARQAALVQLYQTTTGAKPVAPPACAPALKVPPHQAMLNELLAAGHTAAQISAAIGYSGRNGPSDLASFANSRARDMAQRIARLQEYYAAHMSDATTKPSASPPKVKQSAAAPPTAAKSAPLLVDDYATCASTTTATTTTDTLMVNVLQDLGVPDSVLCEVLGFAPDDDSVFIQQFLRGEVPFVEARRAALAQFYDDCVGHSATGDSGEAQEQEYVDVYDVDGDDDAEPAMFACAHQ